MALSQHRIVKSKGRVVLVETANPAMGVGYAVRSRSVGVWSGDSLTEAEKQFDLAVEQLTLTTLN